MNQIALLPNQMPQHIAQSRRDMSMNDAAMANWIARFAVVSFKGKRWAVRYRGEETILEASLAFDKDGRPLPEEPITSFPVVILGVAPHLAKTYYVGGYTDGDEKAPDCWSIDSTVPDPASPNMQSPTCAACPQNVMGSAMTENHNKAKACRDVRRIAVVPAYDIKNEKYGGPMLMRIPAMSIENLLVYAKLLKDRAIAIAEVVTWITFDPDAAYPRLMFTTNTFIEDPDGYRIAGEHAASEVVRSMLFEATAAAAPDNRPTPTVAPTVTAARRPAHAVQNPQLAPATPVTSVTLAAVGRPTPTLVPPPTPQAPPAAAAAPPPPAPLKPPSEEAQKITQMVEEMTPPPTTVVQGAPANMEEQILDLLSKNN